MCNFMSALLPTELHVDTDMMQILYLFHNILLTTQYLTLFLVLIFFCLIADCNTENFRTVLDAPELNLSQKFSFQKTRYSKIQSPAVLWCHLLFHGFKSWSEVRKKKAKLKATDRGKKQNVWHV